MSTEKEDSSDDTLPKNSVSKEFLKGAFGGAVEVAVNHPLWVLQTEAVKRATQKNAANEKLGWRGLYRGIGPNAVSMVGVTAMQMGFRGFFQNRMARNDDHSSSKVAASFTGGFFAATIAGPTECVMTAQNVTKNPSFVDAAKQLAKQHGVRAVLHRGTTATGIRDGIFTVGYTEAKKMLQSKFSPDNPDGRTAGIAAGVGAGVGAAILSHPVNVVKSVQHLNMAHGEQVNAFQAANQVWQEQGTRGFFKGLVPRGARVVSAICLIGTAIDELEKRLLK